MLTQHKKLMDEAQRLEPSVMVTERNWNAMLKMQHDLFQQQMQLDADLKTLLTREDAQTALNEMQESTEKFEKQAGSLNERYSSDCKALTENTKLCPDRGSERYEEAAFGYGTGSAEENSTLRVDINYGSDLVRGAVRLGRAVEQMTDNAPVHDGTTTPPHIDSKRRKKLRQKKTALGHAEDDHEDWNMEQKM